MACIYKLTGTPDELRRLLHKEFSMDDDLALFFVTLLLTEGTQSAPSYDNSALALWYVNSNSENYKTPIFNSRYSISFTELGKNLGETIFLQIGSILDGADKFTASVIFSCLVALYKSSTHIESNECCVYYQAIKWKASHPSQEYFSVEDILPHGNEGYCLNLENINNGEWACHSCHNERCIAPKEMYCSILSDLVERKVLVRYNNLYRFEK